MAFTTIDASVIKAEIASYNASVKAEIAKIDASQGDRHARLSWYLLAGFGVHATLTLAAIGIAAGVAIAILK